MFDYYTNKSESEQTAVQHNQMIYDAEKDVKNILQQIIKNKNKPLKIKDNIKNIKNILNNVGHFHLIPGLHKTISDLLYNSWNVCYFYESLKYDNKMPNIDITSFSKVDNNVKKIKNYIFNYKFQVPNYGCLIQLKKHNHNIFKDISRREINHDYEVYQS